MLEAKHINLSAHHGTLTQCLAHPKVPVCLQKTSKSNLNINQEIRSVITLFLHISNFRIKPAGFDFQYNKISKQNLLRRTEKQKRRKGITKFQLCMQTCLGRKPSYKKYACCTARQKRDIFQFHFLSLRYQSLAEVAS